MSGNLKDLREKRNKIVIDARAMLEKAKAESRALTGEEEARWNTMMGDVDKIGEEIKREERMADLERGALEMAREQDEKRGKKGAPATVEERTMAAFGNFLRTGRVTGEGAEEFRALQADSDTAGGFLIAPQMWVSQLIKGVDDLLFIRQKATVFPVGNADSLGAPYLAADPDDADWTSELATGSEDSSMSFGKRELKPHPLAKRIKLSNKLLMKSLIPAEQLTRDRLAYKFAVSQEKAFLTGTGAGQPLGLFTASANGISTGRDVSTGNTATEIKADGLINTKYSLKAQYQRTAEWLFHRDAVKMLAKMKDGDGQYLWRPSLTDGEPDMLLGRPVNQSEYVPNTFSTGRYVGLFGDMSHYWIADSMAMQIQVLKELYAETNQTGFIGRLESDGMPVLEEAFARVKLG